MYEALKTVMNHVNRSKNNNTYKYHRQHRAQKNNRSETQASMKALNKFIIIG